MLADGNKDDKFVVKRKKCNTTVDFTQRQIKKNSEYIYISEKLKKY
jgi:hypothetical protein